MTKILITGCTGFIGGHLTHHFLKQGATIVGIDNLSRKGSAVNLELLPKTRQFHFHRVDIRDFGALTDVYKASGPFDLVIHQAGQVAVTTSVSHPREDFETNALGTFNVLEATRLFSPEAVLEFASTNKVYGEMQDAGVTEKKGRYAYSELTGGVDESHPLDFHSPYGCSKGCADQYVRDYHRIYGLRTVVLRQSCIYGTNQFGIEDQGWVAWFTIASILGKSITIYGDGKQVRDVLWIQDLVQLYDRLYRQADLVAGEVFNVGGGPENCLSLLELVNHLKVRGVLQVLPACAEWRPGDQRVFICNPSKAFRVVGWRPETSVESGLDQLIVWATSQRSLLQSIFR